MQQKKIVKEKEREKREVGPHTIQSIVVRSARSFVHLVRSSRSNSFVWTSRSAVRSFIRSFVPLVQPSCLSSISRYVILLAVCFSSP